MNQTKLTRIQQISVVVIVVIAVMIRFIHLGSHPLSENEAKLALQALATSKGTPVQWSGEALYLALTTGIFSLFDKSNFTARLIPAIFGLLFVFSPFLFRRSLGNTVTILLCAFLALDPAMVTLSRTAGGALITLFVLAAAFHFLRNGNPIFSGVLCGLALLSGTGVWSVLLPFTIAILIWVIIYRKNWNFAGQSVDPVIKTVRERTFGIALILSIVIIGTAFFIFPRSLSALTSSIPDYLRLWKEQGSLTSQLFSLGILIYFPLGLLLGIWGGVRGIIKQDRPRIFLLLWTLVGMVLLFVSPARDLTQIIWVSVPLYLLAAQELSLHFNAEQGDLIPSIGIALLVFIMIAFLWLSFGRITYGGDQKELLIAVGAGLGILLLSGILIVLGWSAKIAGKGILWGILGVFSIYMLSTAWRVSGISTLGQTEMIGAERSLTQIALIDKTISELSNWTAESSKGIQVSTIGLNSRALEWGLKDYPNTSFRMDIPGDEHPPIVIAAKDEPFNFQERYRGQDFIFESSVDWQSFQPMDWISWLVHRKTATINSFIVLWARADLFPGGAVIPLQ